MVSFLEVSDLTMFAVIDEAKAQAMIDDATADAIAVAPCLEVADLSLSQSAAVRSILRAAVLRWNEAGSGAVSQQSAGPFSATLDTRQDRRGMFFPSEITRLQKVCGGKSGAFTVDTVPSIGFDDPDFDFYPRGV